MGTETPLRKFARSAVDRADPAKLHAILELLDEDFFSSEEINEIRKLGSSDDRTEWREIRRDV